MTRSDVFNRITRPLFWLAHMLPIYRQQDGGNSQEKNKKVFKKATETLARNRNLLMFGEGITDDVFERRLKPIKKGAMRIGFTALEDLDWKVEIRVQGVGINYTNPGIMRSEVLVAAAEPIVLNNYREAYLENPSKVISELNRELELRMQAQITHVRADEHVVLHEQIMMLNRKGMHVNCYDPNISLEERWLYSQKLANYLNGLSESQNEQISIIKNQIDAYQGTLRELDLKEAELYWFAIQNNWRLLTFLKLLVQLPLFLIGLVHIALPTLFVKRFVEKKMKRPVFWSSTKMTLLLLLLPIWNILLFVIASNIVSLDTGVWIFLFFAFNLVAIGYYLFLKNTTLLIKSFRYNAQSLRSVVAQRDTVLQHLETLQF
jgi:hypothetical protein